MYSASSISNLSWRGLFLRPWQTFVILSAFLFNSFGPQVLAQADAPYSGASDFNLPLPGIMVNLSQSFDPPLLKGIKVHTDNPLLFDFILDRGDSELSNDQLKDKFSKLIKYFLASLTIPENDLWVNLSPYEKDRIIPQSFGLTEMGRDLLAEDYMLKQITASLIYPEGETGKKFWKRVYEDAIKKYGTTNIPVNTFNKVWIVPQKAVVYENVQAATAYIVESKLKVMLEQDYLSLEKHAGSSTPPQVKDTNQLGSQMVREIVIPELNKEVNENKNFTQLRQVYNSLILATWYKMKIRDSILEQIYTDKNKTAGVRFTSTRKNDVEAIYKRYLQAFKRGVYNYIKEEQDPITQEMIPRKYFSGGVQLAMKTPDGQVLQVSRNDPISLTSFENRAMIITVGLHELVNKSQVSGRTRRDFIGRTLFGFVAASFLQDRVVAAAAGGLVKAIPVASKEPSNPDVPESKEKWEAHTNNALNELVHNISTFDPITKDMIFSRMRISESKLSELLKNGYDQSTYFKFNFTPHDYVKAVMTIAYIESGFKIEEKKLKADQINFDLGAFGIADFSLKHSPIRSADNGVVANIIQNSNGSRVIVISGKNKIKGKEVDYSKKYTIPPWKKIRVSKNNHVSVGQEITDGQEDYYNNHPEEYIHEALPMMDSFLGQSLKILSQVRVVYGDYLFDYFNITNDVVKKFLAFRATWNVGIGFKAHNFVLMFSAMYITVFRITLFPAVTAKAKMAFSGGEILDRTIPGHNGVSNEEERIKANERFLWHFEIFNRKVRLSKRANFQALWADFKITIDGMRKKFKEQGYRYVYVPPSTPAEYLRGENLAMINTSTQRNILTTLITANKGGIDLTPAHMNFQALNAGETIKFHMNPAMLAQLRNTSGFLPVIIKMQSLPAGQEGITDLRLFLGLKNKNNASLIAG